MATHVPNRERITLGVALASATLLAAACQWVGGIDDRAVDESPSPEAGTADASGIGAPDAALACARASLPAAPAPGTSSPSDATSATFVVSTLRLRSAADAGVGFDLDRTCTCPGPDTCRRPMSDSGSLLAPACDDPGGVDNAARLVFDDLAAFKILDEGAVNNALAHGVATILVRIDRYNGLPDDARVDVSVYASPGLNDVPDASPRYDGNDAFLVDNASLIGSQPNQPRYLTTTAYVSGGKLVATLDFPVLIGGVSTQPVATTLRGGAIVADLRVGANGISDLRGTIAGRWNIAELVDGLQILNDPAVPSQHLCVGSTSYEAVVANLCSKVDITSSPAADNTSACDALSIAIGFDAKRAQIGPVRFPPRTQYCDAGYVPRCP